MEHDRSPFDSLGGAAEVWTELMAFTHSAQFLSETTSRLMEEYPKQWVAVFDGRVESVADSFQEILQQVDARNLPRDKIIVRYIDKEPKTMIL